MTVPTLRHPASQRFHEILRELGDLHDRKQRDYGRSTDPFANVRASEEWGVQPWVGALIRLNDKVRRLQVAAQGGTLSNEGVVDSLRDIAVYAVIAEVLYGSYSSSPGPSAPGTIPAGLSWPGVGTLITNRG